MRIAWMGCGKLGLTCALACESRGHEVFGYDPSSFVREIVETRTIPYKEEGAQSLMDASGFKLVSVDELLEADIIFVATQTPHGPEYEGVTSLPETRADFDYTHLGNAIVALSEAAERRETTTIVSVVSTVLPGTMDKVVKPVLSNRLKLVYSPSLIAMGTCVQDYLQPEMTLLGSDDPDGALDQVEAFFKTIHSRPIFKTDIKTAELIKVAYNTYITQKINYINMMMEICHKTGANVDDLSEAMSLATDRIVSSKYMQAGMGDGGGCHPRDLIAMSWLARELDLSVDYFEVMALTREAETGWLVDLIIQKMEVTDLPCFLLGRAYKPESNLTIGSPAILLKNLLEYRLIIPLVYDPHVDGEPWPALEPAVYFVATKHPEFKELDYPKGSVVLDPWGFVPDQDGVEVVRIGR